jgi:(R,R)-butanediol dehydrogenase/meso-butanediol dehydrogenase/diacetyl reductase
MQAKAIICDEQQQFSLQEVTLPDMQPDQIQIRSAWTGISIGTEFALIRNKISWGPYPLCTGYQGTGIVEAVGDQITNFKVGDRVYFRRNDAMLLADGTKVSCVSGSHCSHAILRPNTTHGADQLHPDAPMDVASMFVMPAVGLFGADMASPKMGSTVVVHGAGLIGQGVIATCVHRGCVVIAVDLNPKVLEIAAKMGADYCINAGGAEAIQKVKEIVPEGADTVFEVTGIPQCVDTAVEMCRRDGNFVWQGNYGAAPVSFNFLPAHGRRLRMFFPCDDGLQPCRRAVIRNMAMGALKWEHTITHRIGATEAPEVFDRINKGDRDLIGVIINWGG